MVWGAPEIRHSVSRHREPADRHARRRARAARRGRRRAASCRPRRHPARGRLRATSTSTASVGGVTSALSRATSSRLVEGRVPARVPRRGARRLRRPAGRERHAAHRVRGRRGRSAIFLLLQAAFRQLELARLAFLACRCRWSAACWRPASTAATSPSARWPGSSPCSASRSGAVMLLIRRYQQLERHEGEPFGPDWSSRGTRERLASIAGDLAGHRAGAALPLVVFGDRRASEIVQPMAVVILGGLVTTVLVSLFVVPAPLPAVRAAPRESRRPLTDGPARHGDLPRSNRRSGGGADRP